MYCRNCGKQLTDDARFCMYCGTPVAEAPNTAAEEPETPAQVSEPLETAQFETPEPAIFEPETKEAETAQWEPETVEKAQKQEPEPVHIEYKRSTIDEPIRWNVSDYPDSNDNVAKTEDINFDWNTSTDDIADTDTFTIENESNPSFEDVLSAEELESDLFDIGDDDSEELSAAERIDKFYTFNKKNEEFQQLLNKEYDKVKSGNAIGEELSKADAIAEERFESIASSKPQTMDDFLEAEGIVKPYQPKAFESDVLERIEAQEAEREIRRLEEEARKAAIEKARAEAEAARIAREKEEEEARLAAEEAARLAKEAAIIKAEEEAREAERLAEEARIKAEEEARLRAEEEAKRQLAEAKIRAEEEARRVAEEEARIKAEAVARYQAAEKARLQAEAELKAAQESAKLKAQQEARIAAEKIAREKAAQEAKRLEEEEAERKLEENRIRLEREANESIAQQEARRLLEQTARLRDEEAAKIKAAVAGLRASIASDEPFVSEEVRVAHEATKKQIDEMAKARDTFFGQIDAKHSNYKELEIEEVKIPEHTKAKPKKSQNETRETISDIKELLNATEMDDIADKSQVTGRETMLGNNLSDTRVVSKADVLAAIASDTIAASKDEFSEMTLPAREVEDKSQNHVIDEIEDLLSQLETVEDENESIEDEIMETSAEISAESESDDEFDAVSDFADLDGIGGADAESLATADEPTMVFGSNDDDVFNTPQDLSGTRRFDFDTPQAGADGATIVIGETPQSFAELPSNDFDDYGNEEASQLIAQQAAQIDAQQPEEPSQPEVLQAEEKPLTKKEKKAAAKAERAAAKAEAKAAKKAKKNGSAPAKYSENGEEAEVKKGGIGRKILIVILVILCITLIAEVVGIGIHYVAPQSKLAETIDNQLNYVIHMITGEEQDYSVFSEQRREGPVEDMNELIVAQADKNYNNNIQTLMADKDLNYDNTDVSKHSDLVLAMPMTEFEWGRDKDNKSVYYDEEVIGTAIAYESQKYEYLKSGDEKVLEIVAPKSGISKSLKEKKGTVKGDFSELLIGEIRTSGSSFYVWIKETIDGKTQKRVLRISPVEKFKMVVDRGYDV